MRRHLLGHFVSGAACRGEPSTHHFRVGEEVQVVGEVGEPVEAVSRSDFEVLAVGPRARLIGTRCCGLVADARVDMGGHVSQMAGCWRQAIEPRRARERPSRRRRRLDRVDVVMIGAKMIRISRENRLEDSDDLLRALSRLAVERP